MHNFKEDSDKFEIESQMTLHVIYLIQLPIYGTKLQRFSHVLVELICHHESITDSCLSPKIQKRDIFPRSCFDTCYAKHSCRFLRRSKVLL